MKLSIIGLSENKPKNLDRVQEQRIPKKQKKSRASAIEHSDEDSCSSSDGS